jgi:serine/threonine-protein kinase
VSDQIDRLNAALGAQYRFESELGRGGMATVYRAEDLRHARPVAVKVLRPGQRGGYEPERFLREVRIAARLTHPQIVPVHDSGERDGLLYYVMPYIGGESLRQRLTREPRLPVDQALRIARGVAQALDYAHRQGVLHRDIKPENILLLEGNALVADFGVARALYEASAEVVTEPGLAVGTPSYMSPEQASGDRELDGRSDQYALACVLHEMLAGQPPFAGTSPRATMARHSVEQPPPVRRLRAEVPVAVEQALLRALAKDPAARFPSAADFANALITPLSGLPGPEAAETRARSVAVLPFVNASPDPENEYFSDGMTDELINALVNVEGLVVASRTSVFAFKGRREDVRTIGAVLNVSAVLEGTVRRAGTRLRITAQLTNVIDGRLLWSERFDREDRDVFAIQDEIARTIVQTLRASFLGQLGEPVSRQYTGNLRAYNLYLRGRFCWNKRTPEGIAEAIQYFEQAIVEDPGYALAYTGLADAYALHVDYRAAPVAEGMRRAKEEARRALALDDTLAEAHTSLGWVTFIYDWDWEAARVHFERAIALNPRYATGRQWYSWYLAAMGRTDEALAHGRMSVELDPASVSIRRGLGWLYFYARQPESAVEHLERALMMNPTSHESHLIMGLALSMAGREAEAEAALREALALSPGDTHAMAVLGRVALRQGRPQEARAILAEFDAMARSRYVSPTDRAKLLLALGEYDEAFDYAERSRLERRGWLAYMRVEPLFDPLREDPRYLALRTRMGLE